MTEQSKNQIFLFSKTAALQGQLYGKVILKDGTHFLYTDHMYEVPLEHAVERYNQYFNDIISLDIKSEYIAERIYPIPLNAQTRIDFSNDTFTKEQEFLFYSPSEAKNFGSIITRTYDGEAYEYTTSFNSEDEINNGIFSDRKFVKLINRSNIAHQEVREVNLLSRVKSMFKKK